MDKRLIAVLFLIFVVVFSFGCEKEEVTEEPEEELPEVTGQGYTFIVNNYPGGKYDIEDFFIRSCGSIQCDHTMRTFTLAKVEKIDGRKLELNLFNEIVNVDVEEDVNYEIFIHNYNPGNEISELTPISTSGDHFDEIRVGDLIGVYYELNQGYEIIPQKIMIIKLEEVK